MNYKKLGYLLVLVIAVISFFTFDLSRFLSLDFLKAQQSWFAGYYQAYPLVISSLFFLAYVLVAALSLPGAAVMTLMAGALFGFWVGLLLVSFASSLGATFAFLTSRFLLRDWVQARFGEKLRALNSGIDKEGAFYLFTLRLVPIFPFFVINLLMGLTSLKTRTFYGVSQVGMLLGTAVYVNAGTQLAQINHLQGIVSPELLFSFALLGIFPWLAKKGLTVWRRQRVYARWNKPQQYDYNLVVIGAGSAGLVSSYIGAAVKAKVALIEKHRMGGDCLNTGCVPSKALIRSAKFLSHLSRAQEFGLDSASAQWRFANIMERVQRVVREIEPHDSVARYTDLGVDCFQGQARICSPWEVELTQADGNKRLLTTRHIIIAAGARPFVPPIPGLQEAGYLTSDTVWNLRELPRRLIVLGGGPIGTELAQCFARLGSQVTQVEMGERLMPREDGEVSALVMQRLRDEGVQLLTRHQAQQVIVENGEKYLVVLYQDEQKKLPFDELLVAVGRVANTSGYGLEELGIATTAQRTVETDAYLQTLYPNIWACGDVAGPFQFTHTAAHQAWYAVVNALFGQFKKFRVDYRVIPWATFTEPEVARVGLNEQEARQEGVAYDLSVYGIDDLDRAIADSEAHGFIKVLTAKGSDKILGVTIVGEHAGDLLAEYVLAIKHGIGLNKILGTIHIYPTLAEANKYAAGVWKRGTVTRGQWSFLSVFQAWQRGEKGLASVLRALPALWRDRTKAY